MGQIIVDNGKNRELVKVASKNHPAGYYTNYRDAMKPGEVEFKTPEPAAKQEGKGNKK